MRDNLFGREVPLVDLLERRRQHALDTLAAQYAQGMLDEREFETALQEVRDAPSEAALATMLERYVPTSVPNTPAHASQTVYAILSERTMKGDWITARSVTATTVMGDLTLDMRDVVLTEDTHIHVVTIMGELKILLPPEMAVENNISAVLAEQNDSRGSRRHGPGPTLRLTGTALLAEVSLR
ncbi:MAG TPA: LiaF domain-containing protein [Alkalispirochaeta sp.]|nr:LiaF domain-containing protein [Alkalispirochaeta sp.]